MVPLVGGLFFPPLEVWVFSGGIMIGVVFTLGKFGATLGGRPGACVAVSDGTCCSGWIVVC